MRDSRGRFGKGHTAFKPIDEKVCLNCWKAYMPTGFIQQYCQPCRLIKIKGYKKKYDNSEKKRLASRRYFAKDENRPKYQARWHVNEAIRKGTMIKPKKCEKDQKEGKVCAHHYLGYDKEHRLDIIWLCSLCHSKIHMKGGDVK